MYKRKGDEGWDSNLVISDGSLVIGDLDQSREMIDRFVIGIVPIKGRSRS